MTDDLAAQLAEWGEDFEEALNRAVAEEDETLKRSLSLLAAVEAALKLVDEWKQIPFAVRASDECAGELRAAISAALAAEEASNG